jgi:sugar phosphate isomerase/epimerase
VTRPAAVQLYTLRDEIAKGMRPVIERLAKIGYAGVEPAGFGDLSPKEFKSLVDANGQRISSAHAQAPLFGDTMPRVLDEMQEIGCPTVVVPMLPPDRFGDADGCKRMAERMNNALGAVRERGMALAYHNHWFEFAKLPDGRTGFDVFVESLEPDVALELDIYWAQTGGADPAATARELGSRCRLLHVKDGPATEPGADMVAVGKGAVDVAAVLEANENVAWHIVELDRCATDMFEAVEQSLRYLIASGLSSGRE